MKMVLANRVEGGREGAGRLGRGGGSMALAFVRLSVALRSHSRVVDFMFTLIFLTSVIKVSCNLF